MNPGEVMLWALVVAGAVAVLSLAALVVVVVVVEVQKQIDHSRARRVFDGSKR